MTSAVMFRERKDQTLSLLLSDMNSSLNWRGFRAAMVEDRKLRKSELISRN